MSAGALLASAGTAWPKDTAADRKIRIAVVGGGFGASFQWHQHPRCVVTGVTDLRPERRQRLRATYRCGAVYDSLETMGTLKFLTGAQRCRPRSSRMASRFPLTSVAAISWASSAGGMSIARP